MRAGTSWWSAGTRVWKRRRLKASRNHHSQQAQQSTPPCTRSRSTLAPRETSARMNVCFSSTHFPSRSSASPVHQLHMIFQIYRNRRYLMSLVVTRMYVLVIIYRIFISTLPWRQDECISSITCLPPSLIHLSLVFMSFI